MRTAAALAGLVTASALAQPGGGLWCFTPDRREAQAEHERELLDSVSTEHLRAFHDLACAEPHPAGSTGDRALIQRLATELTRMGLDVEVQWFEALLARPIEAHLELVLNDERFPLALKEPPLDEDAYTQDPNISIGFNAYAASGDVTCEYVYANYATWQDFERLEELGIDVEGKIILARYGGNYRGYKAYFAQQAGAAGLVIYTDPQNSARGPVYPEGGWANPDAIQRGSILVEPYPGDPLTPGVFAGPDAERLAIEDAGLPTIPVQPIGYRAAEPILKAMTGPEAPDDWQGGIDTTYRLTSGDARLRLMVEQEREVVRTANVIASLEGAVEPHMEVIAGCHHDAWTHGAGDPGAGTMVLLELARVFAQEAQNGNPPERTLRFAFWGAEEYGIIGSTEYVESRERALRDGAVAYINLDMAAMGTEFRASASPSLARVIREAAGSVPALSLTGMTMLDEWRGDTLADPEIGTMGGGSDHVAFLCRAGVPCMALAMRGSQGVSYHSAHDTLAWYRKVVGEDYEGAKGVTQVSAIILSRLANADVLPTEPWAYAEAARAAHEPMVESLDRFPGRTNARLATAWDRWERTHHTFERAAERVLAGESDRHALNMALLRSERAWITREGLGLPDRDWYRNHFAAPDERSGYSAWTLPGIRAAIERQDNALLAKMTRIIEGAAAKAQGIALSVRDEHRARAR